MQGSGYVLSDCLVFMLLKVVASVAPGCPVDEGSIGLLVPQVLGVICADSNHPAAPTVAQRIVNLKPELPILLCLTQDGFSNPQQIE